MKTVKTNNTNYAATFRQDFREDNSLAAGIDLTKITNAYKLYSLVSLNDHIITLNKKTYNYALR